MVSVHLSGEMSGTVDAARVAARDAVLPVEVVDSRSLGYGLGFPVLAAAQAAARGAGLAEVASVARDTAAATRSYFYVDTLEHLRRSGRVSTFANLLGSALAVKPLMHITDGSITLLEKVRTSSRALSRLEDLTVTAAAEDPVNIAVQHLSAHARAQTLADHLTARIPKLSHLRTVEVGAAIGAHTGPGMLAVTVSPHIP